MTLERIKNWRDLEPIFRSEGGRMPESHNATGVAAYDENGLAGFWVLQMVWHAGPLWIRPDLRGKGLWRRLHAALHILFDKKPGSGYYSFSGDERMDHVFAELGYRNLNYKVWSKEI